jgi:hypothetical protein
MKKLTLLLVLSLLFCQVALGGQNQKEKEKDKVRAPRMQAEITLRLVEAGSEAAMANDAAALIPQELQKLLTFTRYHLLDSGYIRGVEDEDMSITLGGNLLGKIKYRVRAGVTPAELEYEVEIQGPRPEKGSAQRMLQTSATGKSGETVVLGASRMKESSKALIVLLTGKLLP